MEEQRALLEDICDVRDRLQTEVIKEHLDARDTQRRFNELVDRWERRYPDSRVTTCGPGGYCFGMCPAMIHPGRFSFPPLLGVEREQCGPALAANHACTTFVAKACGERSYLCQHATIFADHARCHPPDDLLAVLAREACSGYLHTWSGEPMPDKPYVSTAGDPAWCKLFADPPPECGGAEPVKPPPETAATFCARLSTTKDQEEACFLAVTRRGWVKTNAGDLRRLFPETDARGRETNTVQRILDAASTRAFMGRH